MTARLKAWVRLSGRKVYRGGTKKKSHAVNPTTSATRPPVAPDAKAAIRTAGKTSG